jgi:hypothetical protein
MSRENKVRTVRVEIAAEHQRPRKSPEQLLKEIVTREVAEILFKQESFLFEPFFRSKKIADEIRRLQTIPEWQKWAKRFDLYGCLDCKRRDAIHRGCGMCETCYCRIREQMRSIVRRHKGRYEEGQYETTVRDEERMAQQALSGEPKALSPAPAPARKKRIYSLTAAAAAAIDPKTLSGWIRSGAVQRPPRGIPWEDDDIEELKLIKSRNLSMHNSKASLARWEKRRARLNVPGGNRFATLARSPLDRTSSIE